MSSRFRHTRVLSATLVIASFGILSPKSIGASVSYGYDPVGRVATALYDNGLCTVYAYDPNGNRTAQTTTSGGAPVTPTWGTGVWGCAVWSQQ